MGFPVLTVDAPCVSGAFGAGAVDYGYERRSSDPAKPAGSEDRRPCRRGDNIGLAADGAERGWDSSELANFGLGVAVPNGLEGWPGGRWRWDSSELAQPGFALPDRLALRLV
ncbi:hypothetical protein GCM10009765_16870 [Fodinicola feengrottensis]|uniref:Uncharacterized protein n=1 Tax=Fodinicola feengrottensis TaxID=435914 RepID=A0ABN2GC19_9ACTN